MASVPMLKVSDGSEIRRTESVSGVPAGTDAVIVKAVPVSVRLKRGESPARTGSATKARPTTRTGAAAAKRSARLGSRPANLIGVLPARLAAAGLRP
jgi:hypothetical protein